MSEIKPGKKVSNIREDIKGLTSVEINELIEGVKEDFQIKEEALIQATAAAPVEEKKEEKTGNVSVRIVEVGKLEISESVKLFRAVKGAISKERKRKGEEEDFTLTQAKNVVNSDDKIILENAPSAAAKEFEEQLEKEGLKDKVKLEIK